MKGRILTIGVLALILGIIGTGTLALAGTDKSSEAYWTLGSDGAGCSVFTFSVHGDVDLGSKSSFSPGDVLRSVDNGGWGSNEHSISIMTNCSNWELSVSRADAASGGHANSSLEGDSLNDFYQWVVEQKSPGRATLNVTTEMSSEPNTNNDKDSNSPYSGEFADGTAGWFKLNMGYKYILESHDSPGTYGVDVTYTLSTP